MSLANSLSQAGEMNEPAAQNGAVCGVEGALCEARSLWPRVEDL